MEDYKAEKSGANSFLFSRTQRLLGSETLARLQEMKVIIFGIGGVGSWCAESLVRTGVRHLTIIDADRVCETNINRQAMATVNTIGQPKVEAMRQRLLSINPEAEIEAVCALYGEETAESYRLENYDVIVDAIDSLTAKAQLILHATKVAAAAKNSDGVRPRFYSSMGAALKLDPTKIAVAEFWKVKGCPLARALRTKFKKHKLFPSTKFLCVYSEELLENKGSTFNDTPAEFHKVAFNGSLSHITAIFGFTLAGLIIRDL